MSADMIKAKEQKAKFDDESSEEVVHEATRIVKKFDQKRYPWLSKRTLKIKDIFLFLHSEILDFVDFVSQNAAE